MVDENMFSVYSALLTVGLIPSLEIKVLREKKLYEIKTLENEFIL